MCVMASQLEPNVWRWVVSNQTGKCCIPGAAATMAVVEVMTVEVEVVTASSNSTAEVLLLVLLMIMSDLVVASCAYISLTV